MSEKKQAFMPEKQKAMLRRAFAEYRAARDPFDPRAVSKLASVTNSAHAAGWSRRSIAGALGISTERIRRLAEVTDAPELEVPRYRAGESFPASVVSAFRRAEDQIRSRMAATERKLTALLRFAHASGWPFQTLADIIGDVTGERLRQLAESDLDTSGIEPPVLFEEFNRAVKRSRTPKALPRGQLTNEEKQRLGELAAIAGRATRMGQKSRRKGAEFIEEHLTVRQASEELSALIAEVKRRNVIWADIDYACGYRRGSARARAARHGYGSTPPSMRGYTRTDPEAFRDVLQESRPVRHEKGADPGQGPSLAAVSPPGASPNSCK
ncbi:hypothetical protein [Arthrobacter mobilis]|uniref:Uncharacterized protein n=1 Tax=Arthrobacter mobilis TaxID=2724944 RepID=A0A7X6K6K4_9MICC|nr:hypothetical protein [Arthrobacter mobilis]NKX55974.1 hypothetical protein [Arthrobacter mobilis]